MTEKFTDESGFTWTLDELLADLDDGDHLYLTPMMCADLARLLRASTAKPEVERTIYLVTEEAVYRHRILGVYDSQEAAEKRAVEVAMQEDGHHSYNVWSAQEGVGIEDPKEICRYQRKLIDRSVWPRVYGEPKREPSSSEPQRVPDDIGQPVQAGTTAASSQPQEKP